MGGKIQFVLIAFLGLISCKTAGEKESIERWKQEILETEQNFADMAKEQGIASAFLAFAAEDAVIMRNDSIIAGRNDLVLYFENHNPDNGDVTLTWKPDFVDVSSSGDLGYTYGPYKVSYSDSSGMKRESTGVFHTVWKRQPDGSWKFVWD
jgi:ketosteroid isomerase-like protein